MQQWLDQHGYPFHVTAQEQDTYLTAQGRSNIDYFIVSADLRGVLLRPQIVVLSGLAGHKPVRTGWTKADLSRHVHVWVRTPRPPTLPVYGPQPDPEEGGLPPVRMRRMDIHYPAEGETYVLQGQASTQVHETVSQDIRTWVDRIYPYLQSVVGMEHQPLQDYSFRKVTLRKALRILDEPIQSPRARIVLARHLCEAANRLEAGLPLLQVPHWEWQKLRKQLGHTANTWTAVYENILTRHMAALVEGGDTHNIRRQAAAIKKQAENEIERDRRQERQKWMDQMQEAVIEGAADAFRFVRAKPDQTQEWDFYSEVLRSRNQWKEVWKGTDLPEQDAITPLFAGIPMIKRPRPTPDQIRAAAKHFPRQTAVVDGLHPRHLSLLTDGHLEFVADLYEVWEIVGRPILPDPTLLVKMLPKPTGGTGQ